jgi:hypothetical protein
MLRELSMTQADITGQSLRQTTEELDTTWFHVLLSEARHGQGSE